MILLVITNKMKQIDPSGYTHPTSENTTKDKIYKTFTEGRKNQTNFVGKSVGKKYKLLSQDKPKCLVCGTMDVIVCPCIYNDKTCINGHVWYVDRDGAIKIDNPHKNK